MFAWHETEARRSRHSISRERGPGGATRIQPDVCRLGRSRRACFARWLSRNLSRSCATPPIQAKTSGRSKTGVTRSDSRDRTALRLCAPAEAKHTAPAGWTSATAGTSILVPRSDRSARSNGAKRVIRDRLCAERAPTGAPTNTRKALFAGMFESRRAHRKSPAGPAPRKRSRAGSWRCG